MIDLRSDTVTRPTPAMLEAMFAAPVGDDVFGEDPTVNALEEKAARMFGFEAGLFCPSGTMTNQIAIKVHTNPGDEVICDQTSHVYNYEGGGIAFNSAASVRLLQGERGIISVEQIQAAINPADDVHFPVSKLVVIENSNNRSGGSCYSLERMKEISTFCKENGLNLHLDGARLFNALLAKNLQPADLHGLFDSISICLSKGLGCPVGSVVLGSKDFIKKARRIRKVLGGGMRQAGYLAAACIYALDNHVERLQEDHQKAKELEAVLAQQPYVNQVLPVETNIVVIELVDEMPQQEFLEKLSDKGIKAVAFGPQRVRFVMHLDVSAEDLERVKKVVAEL